MNLWPLSLRGAVALCLSMGVAATAFADGRHGHHGQGHETRSFQRIATFPVYRNTDIGTQTVAEIVAASEDGKTLIYTDSEIKAIGFVDISDPASPAPLGMVQLSGEPTSVAVVGGYALVAVNTSDGDPVVTPDAVSVPRSGELVAVRIDARAIERTWSLPGQPDSIAVGPKPRHSGALRYAAIAIENEREEDGVCLQNGVFTDLGEDDCEDAGGFVGPLPQSPAGSLVILDIQGSLGQWSTRTVALTGLADEFPGDPETEYVAINALNIAAISLQENNHLALVHLPTGKVIRDFSAGKVDLAQVDGDDNDLIEFTATLPGLPREPDGLTWLNSLQFATANEGDYVGGGRGFSIFNIAGQLQYSSGSSVEHAVARVGHYPEGRSDNKGNEPENVAFGQYGSQRYMFVASERASVVLVYQLPWAYVIGALPATHPKLVQVLPTGVGPEGVLAIPSRNLLVVAHEEDDRDAIFRSGLSIYRLEAGEPGYPTVVSADRPDGTPIPWAALSGLAVDPADADRLYTVYDSFFDRSRIFVMDRSHKPAVINAEIELRDSQGLLQAVQDATAANPDLIPGSTIRRFLDLVNDDGSVNLDPEGIAVRQGGGFWIASEGAGESGDLGRDFAPGVVVGVDANGNIDKVITLPGNLAGKHQRRFGLEGVTTQMEGGEEVLYVAFQRAWTKAGDPGDRARIGRYAAGGWTFAYYPLDTPTSPQGGWVGLSALEALGDGNIAVIERDNQGGDDARIKKIQRFSLAGVTFRPASDAPAFDVLSKTLVRDLMADLAAPAGEIKEKVEGLAVLPNGTAVINTDNDGVDDSNGETQQIEIPDVF